MIISVGQFRLKNPLRVIQFLILTRKVHKQAQIANGNNTTLVGGDGLITFYSISSWESIEDMRSFAHSGWHKKAIDVSPSMGAVVKLLYFEGDKLPGIQEARRLIKEHPQVRTLNFHKKENR